MSEVPDESRALILPYMRTTAGVQAIFTSDKNSRTNNSMVNHYLDKFITSVKLQWNPLLFNFTMRPKK